MTKLPFLWELTVSKFLNLFNLKTESQYYHDKTRNKKSLFFDADHSLFGSKRAIR